MSGLGHYVFGSIVLGAVYEGVGLETSMEVWFGDEMYDIRSYSLKNPLQSRPASLIPLLYNALSQIMTRNYEYRLILEVDVGDST